MSPRRRAGDHGQAAVELALALPVVAVLLLVLVQVALVVRDQVLVVHAAREAARAAAVDPDPAVPRRAALAAAPLHGERLSVAVERQARAGGRVRAVVSYRSSTFVPLVGPLIPDIALRAHATMRQEHATAGSPGSWTRKFPSE